MFRPTWAEINLDNVASNVQTIKERLPATCEVMAVVKADAYGHGAVQVARAALEGGATWLAVSIFQEAWELRQAGLNAPILVLGYTPPCQAALAAELAIRLTVFEQGQAQALSAAVGSAATLKLHLKIDTGMGRLGVTPREAVSLAVFVSRLPGCRLEGAFTHFASADQPDPASGEQQLASFLEVLEGFKAAGIRLSLAHAANSAAALRFPASRLGAIRLGISLYGFYPYEAAEEYDLDLRRAMALKTTVTQAKWIATGTAVSYGGRFVASKPTYILTLPIGYADGLRRALSNKGQVMVKGVRLPLVGTICMDQCLVDATAYPNITVGDEVLIFGTGADTDITADEVALLLDTAVHEVLVAVSKRVPRLYYRGGQLLQ